MDASASEMTLGGAAGFLRRAPAGASVFILSIKSCHAPGAGLAAPAAGFFGGGSTFLGFTGFSAPFGASGFILAMRPLHSPDGISSSSVSLSSIRLQAFWRFAFFTGGAWTRQPLAPRGSQQPQRGDRAAQCACTRLLQRDVSLARLRMPARRRALWAISKSLWWSR